MGYESVRQLLLVIVVIIMAFIAWFIKRQSDRFLERLRSTFSVDWKELGSPGYNGADGELDGSLFFFIVLGRFYSKNDPELISIGRSIQLGYMASLGSLLPLLLLLG